MGVSIKLYRVKSSKNIQELPSLQDELETASSKVVDLYKMTQDLGIIFQNTIDPFEDETALGYKILFGNYISEVAGDRVVNGYLSSSEVSDINEWINEKGLQSFEGFNLLFSNLTEEAKQELENIGSPGADELYKFFVQPLVEFYQSATSENNLIDMRRVE